MNHPTDNLVNRFPKLRIRPLDWTILIVCPAVVMLLANRIDPRKPPAFDEELLT